MTDRTDAHAPNAIRVVPYPDELRRHGVTLTCPACHAHRDWLLLEACGQVFVRCRCAHEWPEPRLGLDFFDDNFAYADRGWADFGQAMIALGFDGLLAGCMWE